MVEFDLSENCLTTMLSGSLRGRQICATVPRGTHIFFGSATGPLELALGTVPTRGGGV
jgi:hypothetical protein